MSRRLLPALLLALWATVPSASSATAQEIVFLAFGDSITQGYGDTSNLGGGYTRRLERWLNQQGYDSVVESYGVGGETTAQGLSRIDGVLAGGGDFLLLMEGTNDISKRVGIESIRFNLDEMASRAEALGIIAVHATVIPRIPTAPVDPGNSATSALAAAIRSLALSSHRAVVDNFAVFQGLPDLFENYYYPVPDPVGHPNTDGYIQIAGTFLETLLPLLEAPAIEILPPAGPLDTGSLAFFGIGGVGDFVRVEWEFGDGGFAVTTAPGDLSANYLYLHAGTYTVRVRGFTAQGAVSQDSASVVVVGSEPGWVTRTTLLPVVVDSSDGLFVSDLWLTNSGIHTGVAEVTFLPEVTYDTALPVRRFLVPSQGTTTVTEILATSFGLGTGRGAMRIAFYVIPQGSSASFSAISIVRSPNDPDGSEGAIVAEIPLSSWNASAKQILGILHSPSSPATLEIVNLDNAAGSALLDLYDAVGGYIGSGVFELAPNSARLRSLSDLFRGLDSRPAPFRASLAAASIRYSVAALIADPTSDEVIVLTGDP